MTKRKLVNDKAVNAAVYKADELGLSGEVEMGDIRQILEAAAPIIAARALKKFAKDFELYAVQIGIKDVITRQICDIVRRYAKDGKAP